MLPNVIKLHNIKFNDFLPSISLVDANNLMWQS
jgi:hypothetical protein